MSQEEFAAFFFFAFIIFPTFWILIEVLSDLNTIQAMKEKPGPNVQKSDQHRKKNCAVENCNAVVFRMTDFCHRHQNETLTSPNTIDSEDTNSQITKLVGT